MLEKWDDSFAKNQLEKYGWKNGEGLGKDKHGNAKHIAVKVKNDTKGVGKNQEQWDFAWWDHLYNKSASSVSVEKDAEANEIRIATKKKSDNRKSETGILSTYKPTAQGMKKSTIKTQEETTTSSSMAAMADQVNLMDSVKSVHSSMAQTIARSSLYSGFVKSATVLPSETSTPQSTSSSNTNTDDNDSDDDDGKDYSIKMTDAELFAACEGRTARKGGLGLVEQKGKYARVMQDYLAHQNKDDDAIITQKRKHDEDDSKIEKKKKKKKSKDNDEEKKEKKKSKKDKKEKKSKDKEEKKDKKKKKSKKEKN